MASKQQKRWWLYVLRLEGDKWYIGITSKSPEKRFAQHQNGFLAAAWTKRYKPIHIHYTKDLGTCTLEQAQLYEGRVARKYMEQYGDNNVRGGDLTDDTEYVRRFGWFYKKDDWETVTFIILAMLIILAFILDKYHWDIRLLLFVIFVCCISTAVSKIRKNKQR